MCSSDLGPARLPSLVTWPIRKIVMPALLGQEEELGRHLAHLADAAGSGGELRRVDGLHRVDDQRRRAAAPRPARGCARARSRAIRKSPPPRDPEPVAAQLDLALRLLARDVEHGAARAAEEVRHLEEQRALADAGLAADQDHRPRDDPAARGRGRTRRCPRGCGRPRPRRSCRRAWACRPSRGRGCPAGPCPEAPPPAAPRRSCSTRRSRGSGPATSSFRTRRPGRRRRS